MDNKQTIVYSFRTFPGIKQLKKTFPNVFIFGELKEDFKEFVKLIEKQKPKYILGVATSDDSSKVEKWTINKFGKRGKVSKNNKRKKNYLFIPENTKKIFKVNSEVTTSFCNWSMWKISEYLIENKLSTKFTFIHIKLEDLNEITKMF